MNYSRNAPVRGASRSPLRAHYEAWQRQRTRNDRFADGRQNLLFSIAYSLENVLNTPHAEE